MIEIRELLSAVHDIVSGFSDKLQVCDSPKTPISVTSVPTGSACEEILQPRREDA